MKMYKKSELTLVNGLLVNKDGDVIAVEPAITIQANELETLAQKTDYLLAQPAATPMPSLDGFERQSAKDSVKFKTTTPLMDAKMQEAMDLMDELDDVALVEKANSVLAEYGKLIEFAKNDYVIDTGFGEVLEFDTPTLGSILELTAEQVCNVVALAAGMKPEGMSWLGNLDADGIEDADADEAAEE